MQFAHKRKIYIILMLLVFGAVAFSYYVHYQNTIDIIQAEYGAKIELIEQSLSSEIKYTEIVNRVLEQDLYSHMEEASRVLSKEYEKNPAVEKWDLELLKVKVNNMDIYIIDEDLRIVASTVEEEVGFDFSLYPKYAGELRERLQGSEFIMDPVGFSLVKGDLKAYSYQPTPDHRYLLELSAAIQDLHPELVDLNVLSMIRRFKERYDFVADISIYRFDAAANVAYRVDEATGETNDYAKLRENQQAYLKQASETEEVLELKIKNGNQQYMLKYIPFLAAVESDRLIWWRPNVIELIYNEQSVIKAINHQRRQCIQRLVIVALLYFSVISLVLYILNRSRILAYTDYLTKLPNRLRLEQVLPEKIKEAFRKEQWLAVFFLDVDRFKGVNDTYGHKIGDEVLKRLASRLQNVLPKNGFACRLAGDEFVGFLPGPSRAEAVGASKNILLVFESPFSVNSEEIKIQASLGISVFPDDGDSMEELISKADAAMYEAKQKQLGYKIYA